MAKRPGQAPPCVVLRSSWGEAARSFSLAVKDARRQRQMSTLALAEQCGVAYRAILDLERAFPVEPQEVAAVARNLSLPVPDLDTDPVYRLGLLLRQRRSRARLSLAQLASMSRLGIQTILRAERAQSWPRRGTCFALLSVPVLDLRPEDFAAFMRPAPATAHRDSPPPPSPAPPAEPPAPTPRSVKRHLAFTVRIYPDGSMFFKPARFPKP